MTRAAVSREDTWIVVAAFNEAKRLGGTLTELCARYPNVVVVDDGSSDQTYQVALAFPAWVVGHAINCGQGAALQTGIDFALARGAKIVVTFDADGQHHAEDIAALVAPVASGEADVALGSRFQGEAIGLPWSRWLLLKLAVLFTRVFSGIRVSDTHNGLRALSRDAAHRIRITQNRMAHASEILDQIKKYSLRFQEVPVRVSYSSETLAKGQSSWNAVKIAGELLLGRFIR